MNLRKFWDDVWQKHPRDNASTFYNIMPLGHAPKILDVGCGNWRFSDGLIHEGEYVVGCDISEIALRTAKENQGYHRKKTDFVLCDARCLPFRDEAFEGATSFETITLTGKDYRKVLEEMCRVTSEHMIFNAIHEDVFSTVDKKPEEIAAFNEGEIKGLLGSFGLQTSSFDVLTEDEFQNWEVPVYRQKSSPNGDVKVYILVDARK